MCILLEIYIAFTILILSTTTKIQCLISSLKIGLAVNFYETGIALDGMPAVLVCMYFCALFKNNVTNIELKWYTSRLFNTT